MKFKSELDRKQFAVEMSDLDIALKQVDEKWTPSDEIVELFLKRRKDLVGKLKSFRKSQVTKGQWRKNRYKIMRGIKAFHKSTKGKQFHRAMSRFLISKNGSFLSNPFLSNEALKALSSLETHLYIENDYYLANILEDVDREILLEELIPTIGRCKEALLTEKEFSNSDREMLVRVTDPSFLISSIATVNATPCSEVEVAWKHIQEELITSGMEECEDGFYVTLIEKLNSKFEKV